MRNGSRAGKGLRFLSIAVPIAVVLPLIVANHWARLGWRDEHVNYPSRPSGYTQIVNRFGQPCSADARAISMRWQAADNGTTYSVSFHRKLGGRPTAMVSDKGGKSTNLDNDVYGHIQNAHLQPYIEHGIYGYACRAKRNSNEWSTHAFGAPPDEGRGQVLLLTSTLPGEGKSLTSLNLALALASSESRVLVIDADLRRPVLHELVHTRPVPGLVDLMTDMTAAAKAIRRIDGTRLSLLPSGTPMRAKPGRPPRDDGHGAADRVAAPATTTSSWTRLQAERSPTPSSSRGSRTASSWSLAPGRWRGRRSCTSSSGWSTPARRPGASSSTGCGPTAIRRLRSRLPPRPARDEAATFHRARGGVIRQYSRRLH